MGGELGTIQCDAAEYWQQHVWGAWYAIGFHGMVGTPLGRSGIGMHWAMWCVVHPLLMLYFSSIAGLCTAGQAPGCLLSQWHGGAVLAQCSI